MSTGVTGVSDVVAPDDPGTVATRMALAEKHLKLREDGKSLYQQSDEAMMELLKIVTVGTTITLTDGRKFEVIDNFPPGKNVAFRPAGVHRYELKECKKLGNL